MNQEMIRNYRKRGGTGERGAEEEQMKWSKGMRLRRRKTGRKINRKKRRNKSSRKKFRLNKN